MLTKKASAPVRAIKFGLVAPLAILFAMLFRQAPAIAQVVDEEHLKFVKQLELKGWDLRDTVVTFNPATYEEKIQIVTNNVAPKVDGSGKLVYQYAEIQPQFPGGQEAMYKFLSEHIQYPELAWRNNQEGTVVVGFVVDELGNLVEPKGQYYDESSRPFVNEAIRVVESMPKWTPAKHKGKEVRCAINLPVKFKVPKPVAKTTDVDPEFPGGMDAMMKFLTENIKYPEAARAAKAEGMVILKFVVKEDGSLTGIEQAKTDKPLHPDLVTEAIRVVSAMPKWKPGMKEGKVVQMEYVVPMKFKLDK